PALEDRGLVVTQGILKSFATLRAASAYFLLFFWSMPSSRSVQTLLDDGAQLLLVFLQTLLDDDPDGGIVVRVNPVPLFRHFLTTARNFFSYSSRGTL